MTLKAASNGGHTDAVATASAEAATLETYLRSSVRVGVEKDHDVRCTVETASVMEDSAEVRRVTRRRRAAARKSTLGCSTSRRHQDSIGDELDSDSCAPSLTRFELREDPSF